MPAPLKTEAEKAAAELASQYITSTDTAAERAAWFLAAQYALDGDDSDLRYLAGRQAAGEHYLEWANRNPRAADSFEGEFDQWLERNPWAAESYVPAMGSN